MTCHMARAALGACCALAFYVGFSTAAPIPVASAETILTCKTDLESQLSELNVPGLAAAIVKHGKIMCTAAAGMANIEDDIKVTPDTLFLVASISKTVAATALMQLHEQGKFQLDDDVNKYLPFKVSIPAAPTSSITFRQLLTHTASIKDNGAYINCSRTCDYGSSLNPFVTIGADSPIALPAFTQGYLNPGGAYYDQTENFEAAAPGTVNQYSNMSFVLVGYLVEAMSGMPFDQYCREHVFKPLGMEKTSWRLAEIDPSDLAMPYNRSWWWGFYPYGQYGEPDYPDGMLRTSVVELAHFLIAYMQNGSYQGQKILEPATVAEMFKSQTSLDPLQGLAWYQETLEQRRVWGHNGSDSGAAADMWFDPARPEGVILMGNGHSDDADELLEALFKEADGY